MSLHRRSIRVLALGAVGLSGLLGCVFSPVEPELTTGVSSASAPRGVEITASRPFSDFLSAQGTTSLFFPPVADYIGWGNNPCSRFALIDYAGLAATYLQNNGGPTLGTQVTGSVSEHALPDGRAEVTVVVHTKRALSWVDDCTFTGAMPAFGYRASDLLADPSLIPGLSNVSMTVRFTNDAPGAPLPDLVDAFILGNASAGQALKLLRFEASGKGPLRAASGVAEGTPGRLHVSQAGVFMAPGQAIDGDFFPVERVEIGVVGRGTAK